MAAATTLKVKAFNCPNCGAAVELRGFGQAVSAVCIQCLTVIDAKDPNLGILQTFAGRERVRPLIPLGARGKIRNILFEVIGFQTRVCMVEGIEYEWREYVLFNPYQGFRYLSEYNGHWNFIRTVHAIPRTGKDIKSRPTASYGGRTFQHFQTVTARTTFVMGEFPWRVRVGETAETSDYVHPPEMLSAEVTEGEITWSLGEYTPGAQLWQAFQLKDAPPAAVGIYSNQPSPYKGRVIGVWLTFLASLAGLAVLLFLCSLFMMQATVLKERRTFYPGDKAQAAYVTDVFELKGRTSNVEIGVDTDLANNWTYFGLALINESTGEAWDFGRELSYYSGRDSDGAWIEGSTRDSAVVPSVPAGRYYLRVEPETDLAAGARATPVHYTLTVRRDVPINWFFWVAALFLAVPPAFVSLRSLSYEGARWRESDYAGSDGSDEE